MITLYTQSACPACIRVKDRMRELALPYDERNIEQGEYLGELLRTGGKRQVPYMVDSERDVAMYQSADIIRYLETRR